MLTQLYRIIVSQRHYYWETLLSPTPEFIVDAFYYGVIRVVISFDRFRFKKNSLGINLNKLASFSLTGLFSWLNKKHINIAWAVLRIDRNFTNIDGQWANKRFFKASVGHVANIRRLQCIARCRCTNSTRNRPKLEQCGKKVEAFCSPAFHATPFIDVSKTNPIWRVFLCCCV